MPRTARRAPAGVVFHVLNRGVGRREIFLEEGDYAAFERVMAHALAAEPLELLAYCLMPNHWHLLLCPRAAGQLGRFMHRLTMTHTRRWQAHHGQVGAGHLYQGRFKSFPVQDDGHFLTVARYIERNPLRAKLVRSARDWRWSSLWRRLGRGGGGDAAGRAALPMSPWPVRQPADWVTWINRPQTPAELESLRTAIAKGRPFGQADWRRAMVRQLGLESSERLVGRPKKSRKAAP